MANKLWFSVLLAGFAVTAAAQQGNIGGPVAGFAFDAGARALRPIQGIPGAAVLGEGIDFGVQPASVTVAPKLDAALVTGSDGVVRAFRLNSGVAGGATLSGVAANPERVVFSPSGTAAAVYAMNTVQIVTGFPNAPAYNGKFFSYFPGGGGQHATARPFTGSMAVSDDGTLVLIADGPNVRLYQDGAERVVSTAPSAQVAFAAGTHDAVVAGANGNIQLIRSVDTTAAQQTLTVPKGVNGVAFSADSKSIYVASAAAKTVTAIDLGSGTATPVTCDCTITTLAPMGANFRLNEAGKGPLWMLDAGSSQPRIVFVPARTQ